MSEVRLIIRDVRQSLYADWHGAFAGRVIAALSDDPETIEELDTALERFIAPGEWSHFRSFSQGEDDMPYDAGLVIVDLAARLIVCDSTYSHATHAGDVSYHDGKSATEVAVRYHLCDDWMIVSDAQGWQAVARERRRERAADAPLDARAILYGTQLLEFLARECFEAFRSRPEVASEDRSDPLYEQEYDLVRQIHAKWMLTPREDLRGNMPREILADRHRHINWNLQDRSEQWSYMDACPPGLPEESAAYRFGGFGVHETVVYYQMVRHLLWFCRRAVAEQLRTSNHPRAAEFVTAQLPRLIAERDQWLNSPDPEMSFHTPRLVIHHERSRIPEGMKGAEAVIDDDCPLCQMQAELPGPMFWHLDGCNMDDDFAFAIWHRTPQDWEQEKREHEEFSRQFEAREAERKRLGLDFPSGGYADPDHLWPARFSSSQSAHDSAYARVFAIGSRLCELIVDLKQSTQERDLIDRLSRVFGNLREVALQSDPALGEALIDPVISSFCEALDCISLARPDLTAKCADLQDRLHRFTEPPAISDDQCDDDLPS